jgi:quercetin dioxygenase-like cupin family protein
MTQRQDRSATTGGSDQREARPLTAPLLRFELAQEAARLQAESQYVQGDRNARTLAKTGAFRLVMVAFKAGASFDENEQNGSVAIQVLSGRIDLRVGEQGTEIGEGEIAVVSPDNPWAAVASADGVLLLHLAWPPEPGSTTT